MYYASPYWSKNVCILAEPEIYCSWIGCICSDWLFLCGNFLLCSGYGLYKSYTEKPDYLNGFFKRRILPLILAFYSTCLIFLIVRVLMGEKMDLLQVFFYISGLQLSNPNTWFVIVLPIFYFAFYLSFKYIKNEKAALFATCMAVFVYTLIGTMIDHNDWWMRGEWWYNSVHFFSIGLLFARYEDAIINHAKKHYPLYVILCLSLFFCFMPFQSIHRQHFLITVNCFMRTLKCFADGFACSPK